MSNTSGAEQIKPTHVTRVLLLIGIVIATCVILFLKRDSTAFHSDESGWIAAGYYYADLLQAKNYDHTAWECSKCYEFGGLNPHVGKLILGLPLEWFGRSASLPHFADFTWDFKKSYAENVTLNNVPTPDVLSLARTISVVLGVLTVVALFYFGSRSAGVWVGAVAALVLITNNLFVVSFTRAMTDASYNLFLVGGCAACTWLHLSTMSRGASNTRLHRFGGVWVPVVMGIFAALAASVKITGLPLMLGIFGLPLAVAVITRRQSLKFAVPQVLLFVVPALLVVYWLNPVFWPQLQGFSLPAMGQEIASLVDRITHGAYQAGSGQFQQINLLKFELTKSVTAFPKLFLQWNDFLKVQAAEPANHWPGNRLLVLHYNLLVTYATFPFESGLLLIGLLVSAVHVLRQLKQGRLSPLWWPLSAFVVHYVFIVLFMVLNWDRYYLPLIIVSKVMVAIGIVESACWLWRHAPRFAQLARRKLERT